MAKKQFSTLDNEYELSFDQGTEVELVKNNNNNTSFFLTNNNNN